MAPSQRPRRRRRLGHPLHAQSGQRASGSVERRRHPQALEPFTDGDDPNAVAERHHHWACGWIDGFAIRVFRDGQITEAFKAYHDTAERLADYPVLDEEDYSRREYDATLENIADAARSLKHEYDLPEGWEGEVFSWCWSHNQRAVENRDDHGGYPSEDDLQAAFDAIGYARVE